jgi:hypothetical protein
MVATLDGRTGGAERAGEAGRGGETGCADGRGAASNPGGARSTTADVWECVGAASYVCDFSISISKEKPDQ